MATKIRSKGFNEIRARELLTSYIQGRQSEAERIEMVEMQAKYNEVYDIFEELRSTVKVPRAHARKEKKELNRCLKMTRKRLKESDHLYQLSLQKRKNKIFLKVIGIAIISFLLIRLIFLFRLFGPHH